MARGVVAVRDISEGPAIVRVSSRDSWTFFHQWRGPRALVASHRRLPQDSEEDYSLGTSRGGGAAGRQVKCVTAGLNRIR